MQLTSGVVELGVGGETPRRVPSKSHGPTVSSSSVTSYGSAPASTVARVRPPWEMMQVLAAKSMSSACKYQVAVLSLPLRGCGGSTAAPTGPSRLAAS